MKTVSTPLIVLAVALWPMMSTVAAGGEWIVFAGTYSGPESKGIYAYRLDAKGALTSLGLAAEASNPSFLAVHPSGRLIYAVGENAEGTVSAFLVEPEGKLRWLNSVSSRGSDPCHLTFDKSGNWLFVANYSGGSVASFPILSDGRVGEAAGFVQHKGFSVNKQRQSGPHAHSVDISPDNRFLLVNDLGLDQTLVYVLDPRTGQITPNKPASFKAPAGSGPRHLAFSPDGRYAWVVLELTGQVSAMSFNADTGALAGLQTISALPKAYSGARSGAAITVHPSGQFVYASNREDDSITMFSVNSRTGTLKAEGWTPSGGKTPRHIAIDPSGEFLLAGNQDSDTVAVFKIDPSTGMLNSVGPAVGAPTPVSFTFVPFR